MVRTKQRRGRRIVVVGALLVLAIVLVLWYMLAGRLDIPSPIPTPPGPEEPQSQPASCPDVQVVAVPGTWESAVGDDPYAPAANPYSLMLNVTRPLQERFDAQRADVYTVPYVAQFSNPIAIPPDGQQSYNNSRSEGFAATTDILARRSAECPLTTYVLTGFSQGAVIVGDVARRSVPATARSPPTGCSVSRSSPTVAATGSRAPTSVRPSPEWAPNCRSTDSGCRGSR